MTLRMRGVDTREGAAGRSSQTRRAPQKRHLALCQNPALTRLKLSQPHWPNLGARKFFYRVTNSSAKPLYQVLAPLGDGNLKPALGLPPLLNPDCHRAAKSVLELHSSPQPAQGVVSNHPPDLYAVDLVNPIPRMHEAAGELAVISQKDQARRVEVQPADRVKAACATPQVVSNRWPAGRV